MEQLQDYKCFKDYGIYGRINLLEDTIGSGYISFLTSSIMLATRLDVLQMATSLMSLLTVSTLEL